MPPLRRAMRRRLVAGIAVFATAFVPLSAHASAAPDVNALWNEPDGVRVDSALYVIQSWWNSGNQVIPDDPRQRGLAELSEANADLLNAHTLLQEQHDNPGAQPVALIDPLLAGIYNAITGSNINAPLGSLFDSINASLLKSEGRGTRADIARSLLEDYRVKQAVAMRDLSQNPSADLDALLTANAQREHDWLTRIEAVSTPGEGLADLLTKADKSTVALAQGTAGASDHGKGATSDHGKSDAHGQGKAQGQPSKAPANKKK